MGREELIRPTALQLSCHLPHSTSSVRAFATADWTPVDFVASAQLDIEFPVTFEIANPAIPELNTHVGVLEFIAEEGTVNLPQWVRSLRSVRRSR